MSIISEIIRVKIKWINEITKNYEEMGLKLEDLREIGRIALLTALKDLTDRDKINNLKDLDDQSYKYITNRIKNSIVNELYYKYRYDMGKREDVTMPIEAKERVVRHFYKK